MLELREQIDKAKSYIETKDYYEFVESIFTAKSLLQQNNLYEAEVIYYLIKGFCKFNDYDSAWRVLEKKSRVYECEYEEDINNLKGVVLRNLRRYNEAIAIFDNLISTTENNTSIVKSLGNLSTTYICLYREELNMSYLDKAEQKCEEAKIHLMDLNDTLLNKKILNNLAIINFYKQNYNEALNTYFKALDLVKEDAKLYNNIAETYIKLEDLTHATIYTKKAELLADKTKNNFEKAQANRNYGEIAEKEEDYFKAIERYMIAYDYYILSKALRETFKCQEHIDKATYLLKQESNKILKEGFCDKLPKIDEVDILR